MPGFTFDGEHFDLLDDTSLTFAEGRAVEKVTGRPLSDQGESLDSMQALLWVSIKRRRPETKFSDLDDAPVAAFAWDEVDEASEDAADEADPTGADEAPSTPND
jgi:hypothetical protein